MMVRAIREFIRPDGKTGFIVPKAFTYSSSWEATREAILPFLTEVVDAGKVWKEVKLEQVIYVTSGPKASPNYVSKRRFKDKVIDPVSVEKSVARSFGIILNGIEAEELNIGSKIKGAGSFLGNAIRNVRGGMFQSLVRNGEGLHSVVGGKQVQRFAVVGAKGHVRGIEGLPANGIIHPNSILVQNIVAHIGGQRDRIKITAAVPSKEDEGHAVILDTVNQIVATNGLRHHFLAALLNSTLINWYVYRFIYGRAIRTMHFDTPVTDRIPLPKIEKNGSDIDKIADLAILLKESYAEGLKLKHSSQNATRIARRVGDLAEEIDERIYRLYRLSAHEISIIKGSSIDLARDLETTLDAQIRRQQRSDLFDGAL